MNQTMNYSAMNDRLFDSLAAISETTLALKRFFNSLGFPRTERPTSNLFWTTTLRLFLKRPTVNLLQST